MQFHIIYLNHKAKKKDYIFRKLRIIKILSTLSGFNDCFSKTRPDALKIRSDVAELAETTNKDFANKES
jgi:hypothetical protein